MLKKVRTRGIPWPAPSFFRVRRLMCLALAYMAGIGLTAAWTYAWWIWLVPAGCAGLAWLLRRHGRVLWPLLCAGALALGMGRAGMALHVPDLPPTGAWQVEGTVSGAVNNNGRASMFWLSGVQVLPEGETEWIPIGGKMYCYATAASAAKLVHGDSISISGNSYLPTGARNPGGFDQALWMAQNGAHVRLYATAAPKVLKAAGFSLQGTALAWNRALGQRLDARFGEASPVLRAMLLGDQSAMPDDWSRWMQETGVAHLLAVSGLHVGIWFALLGLLLKPLPVSPRVRWALLAVLLGGYAMLTGLRPSVLRAVLMLLVMQGGRVAQRKVDSLTSLSLAALIILLFRPLDLLGASFQLSFCAVLGIVLLRPVMARVLGKNKVSEALGMTLSAQLGILPVASRWFASASLLALLLNLIVIPLAGLLVPVAALGLALDAIWAPLGWLFIQAARAMTGVFLLLTKWTADIPLAYVNIGAFAWWTIAACFVAMLLCCTAVVWRWRYRLLAMVLAAAAAVCIGYSAGSFDVRYVQLDVGQALAGVLHVGRATYVYDTGDVGSDVTEYLLYTGQDVDALFLSHPHMDHVGGLEEMLDKGIRIGTVFVPAQADAFGAESGYAERLAWAEAEGAQIVEVAAGDRLDLNGVQATVIAPEREITRGNDPNDRSIVLLLEIGDHLLLLMGDADGAAEPLGVDTDVLQVAHHGSRNAARQAFLADATPDIALISTGRNSYGHPNPDTVARLEDAGADIYITQDTGAVTLYFEPDNIRVEAYVQ